MLEVFIAEPCDIDWLSFNLWLKGLNLDEACRLREEREPEITKMFSDYRTLLRLETEHYFRMFKTLETFLHAPPSLFSQNLFRISDSAKTKLISHYYSFDDHVVREFLGKKLSSKNRKELDDVSESTGVSLKSCRRQFDNLKRILRVVEDLDGSLVDNIQEQFCLHKDKSRQYAAIVFISSNRFDTMKRATSKLPLRDFIVCANELIDHWTVGSEGSRLRAADDDLELERNFLQELHDLKNYLLEKTWTEKWQKAVMKDLKRRLPNPTCKVFEGHFKALSRSIVSHGSSLLHSKDLKDFFVDILENIVLPLQDLGLSYSDVEIFLDSLLMVFGEVEATHKKPGSKNPWQPVYKRYMVVLTTCVLQLYHPL